MNPPHLSDAGQAVLNGQSNEDPWHELAPERPDDEPDDAAKMSHPDALADPPPMGRVWELDAFLARPPRIRRVLLPGLLDRGDRLILTGPEGGGKSTLLRQIGVQAASGIHPFGGENFQPLRVLLLDLENSEDQVGDALRPLRIAASDDYAGTMAVVVRPEGLDLLEPDDAAWFRGLVDHVQPELLLTGPLYKMAGGDPTEERTARTVAAHLDHIRAKHDCALILEAHSPHASNGGKRPERPYGASLWLRWPEFGLFLDPDTGQLRHWRGPRAERDWPPALRRGGDWPWTPITRPRDILWARIVDACTRAGTQLSERELADTLNTGKTNIHRSIKEHEPEWEAMA